MSDERDDLEGWSAPVRAPLLAAIALLLLLTGALAAGGGIYRTRLGPKTHIRVASMRAPALELTQTPPGERHRQRPQPAGLDRAMADTARQGDALWGSDRP